MRASGKVTTMSGPSCRGRLSNTADLGISHSMEYSSDDVVRWCRSPLRDAVLRASDALWPGMVDGRLVHCQATKHEAPSTYGRPQVPGLAGSRKVW